jgi:NAD+ synthetase
MKIALAQINPTIGDFKGNTDKIIAYAQKAKNRSCDLVIFSELVISGYPPLDLLEKKDFVESNLVHLQKIVNSINEIGVICGFVDKNPDKRGKPLFNSAVLFENGKILHKAYKRLLPVYDVFDESRYFEPGKEYISFSYKGRRIGLTVCEDIWNDKDFFVEQHYPIDPAEKLIKDGANILINISASPYHMAKREFKWDMFGSMAKKYKIPLVHVNQVGGNDSVLFDGISLAFDDKGEIVARARDFEEDMVVFDTDDYKGNIHPVSEADTDSTLNALIMGTRDYMQKCGFSKALVGLSGGIDSALTLCIAVKALGKENVIAVFMPSEYTSDDNFEDSRQLTDNLGIKLITIPIKDLFSKFLQDLSPLFKDVATEVTGQNIQARIRGVFLMAISNKLGYLLLSTGNKSEVAVGYCTLYGDMSGGLAVLSDVPKTMVYQISRLINKKTEVIPLRIIRKAPTAELRPDQLDQDDLPPYETLDDILKAYIEENRTAEEIIKMGFDSSVVRDIISRIKKNEYKRQQAPPGLKVTAKAFGYGRRYPIASKYLEF